ncbi:ferrochelatase [Sinimarinibacterium thermocellulolyticum]|uniref:Ferrochelatase n=1 Tax=Sinimarinibacterium thermocellulolyticum TaxID=3170016 RepID=A0ABV2AD81_9GAMM
MTTDDFMAAADTAHRAAPRTGVLLVNLGTPDAPHAPAIRRYLAEFLGDPRVVETPRALWLPLLYAVILPFRSRKLVHAYASVWTERGSPLLAISRDQCTALQRALGDDIVVQLAMRYGNPSIASAFAAFDAAGVRQVLVLPLYPQYSATTTASVFDAVYAQLRARRWPPTLRTIDGYHDDAGYIAALAASVRAHWDVHGRGEHLLMSFHSIPLRYFQAGDPYYCLCQKTARLLAEALALAPSAWSVSFQSRVGRARWLAPYTDERIAALAGAGVRHLDVICPGFAADCLETLEEVSLRYGEAFVAAGGAALRYIPALNAQSAHIDALAALLRKHLHGWPTATGIDGDVVEQRQHRARSLLRTL